MLFKLFKYANIQTMKHVSNSLAETEKIARDFVSDFSPLEDRAFVVGLYGDLGSGKTTFTKSVASILGVEDTVTSPTFVIEKIYELTNSEFKHLIHIDAYRLEKSEELLHLGWEKIISEKENLILIEWPEKVADIMPKHKKIQFKALDTENTREIEII